MAVWTARGIDPDRLATDADGTLHTRSDAVDGATLDAWQALGLAPDGQAAPGPPRPLVELGVVIGEGGMGVVRAAVQAALRRPSR
ncbi:MAG: hypothetical protein U1F43_07540 [Myxococcota bacterium]